MHPSDGPTGHELYFMCDDLEATVSDLQTKGVQFTQEITEERWGRLTHLRLPGGGEVGMYEPHHPLAIDL
jgi:predicted enzyme related to lactoylglutathione lyase